MVAISVDMIFDDVIYPFLRLALSIGTIWLGSDCIRQTRLFSGIVTAILFLFLAFTFLQPILMPEPSQIALVALYFLSFKAFLIGWAIGVLLPSVCPKLCLSAALSLLVGTFLSISNPYFFPLCTTILVVFTSLLSLRSSQALLLPLAVILVGGGVASSFLVKSFPLYVMDIALGYRFHPSTENVTMKEIDLSLSIEIILSFLWIASSTLLAALLQFRNGIFLFSHYFTFSDDTSNPSTNDGADDTKLTIKDSVVPFRDASPGYSETFNVFNPFELPPRLEEYAHLVYSASEDIGNFFGFQDASVRNQAEHLLVLLSNNRRYMSSHILPPSLQPPSPIHALHAKVFSNYMKWCRSLSVLPNFSKRSTFMLDASSLGSRVTDLILWFCIWGESANLRHMPECILFLYHKMMEEFIRMESIDQTRSLYAGHYLDNVVMPIYNVIAKSMTSKTDHVDKRNYDDFNEFFWSPICLNYHYSLQREPDPYINVQGKRIRSSFSVTQSLPFIAEGLSQCPKTFLEKRAWLRAVLALHRLIEWHIVTFYLLGVISFSRELVFGWVVSIQLASGVFWICNALHTFWNLLEVWGSYPGILQTGTSVCGVTFILIARYSILVFQTLFLLWTLSSQPKFMTGSQADSRFWWWQYIWLSIFCMAPYFVELICQIWPALSTKLLKNQNYYIQSFLNLFYPISRLYIAKDVHESLSHSSVYSFFWVTLITWKLFFSYIFEVYPMVLPTLQLTDDYLNNRNHSLWTMLLLLSMRWLPQFLVYLIDMSIWYAAWQAFSGTAVGFADHLGDVRNIDDIRKNFCRAPENFCQKLLSSDAGSRRGSSASFLGGHSSQSFGDEGTSLLGSDPHKLQPYVNRLLDVRIQKWVMFSAAWNEIIDHFRDEDIISNSESDNLKFSTFDGFSQAVYLPVFQTAGFLDNLMAELERPQDEYKDLKTGKVTDDVYFKPIIEDTIMLTAVSEMWELGSYIFTHMLGPIHAQDVSSIMGTILKWSEKGTLSSNLKCENFRSVMESFVSMIKILSNALGKRKAASSSSSLEKSRNSHSNTMDLKNPAIRRSISAGSLVVETENALNSETLKEFQAYENNKVSTPDALRDMVRDKFRSMVYALKSQIKNTGSNSECQDVMDRLTFLLSMENGFLWDNVYASEQLDLISRNVTYKAVLKKICCLVACHPDEVEPKSKEARRRLTYFINTLFMDIPKAPSLHDMFSWNVLTPYYAEDVTYGKDDLETRSDALGVSTLLYLKTLYRSDWNNFLERMGIVDEETIWSDEYMNETRRWASIRAQTLSRTVNGMMYYEKALRFLGNLERLDNDTTDELVGEKFGYIVSCQVYGNMKRNQDPKATDIENLMHRFPLMRVAYIDSIRVNRSTASIYYSVLVKSNGKGTIQEVYRIRLPGDPIIGEGKPENQNHAMIFTRGEFLQTIDMNQEGYFEEALKMRNCLQEFAKREGPLPTTILGLREHIFTGSVSSLANYMALQETSFVTMGQRVLTRPLCMRLHYGHPDVFDKIFFITRGGISKSSKGINLSEDIFAGYNNVLRGGSVSFKEYLQVGKGRDVGMSQIYKFEAKLSQGAAEQIISRDVYRMCHRLDFFRLLSFYYGGIGHYISNVLTISTIFVVVNLMTLLAIYDRERVGERLITPMGTIQMMLGGLGLLQTIPLFATLGVERGWWNSIQEIFYVFVTGGPLHFMFHIQTKATYMVQTILVGGAKYRPTGRGFVTQHTPFDEQYRFFASSHLYLGVELAVGLILIGIYTDAGQYPGRTWSLWLASLSFLASPFWFNPLTFDWNVVMSDYELWLRWLRCSTGGATKSWAMWWIEENSFYKSISLPSKVFYLVKAALLVFIGEGIRRSDLFSADTTLNKPIIGVGKVLLLVVSFYVINRAFGNTEQNIPYPIRRTVGIISFTGIIAGFATIFIEDTNYIRYALVAYFFLGALSMVGLISGFRVVKNIYFVHDIVCGHIIFIPLFILAALRLPHHIQTWLLYHNALSSDVVVSDILRYARRNQQSGRSHAESSHDLSEEVAELKRIIQRQEQMLFLSSSDSSNQPSTLNSPIASGSSTFPGRPVQSEKISAYARTQSMPGFDVPSHTLEDKPQVQNPKNSRAHDFLFSQPDLMPPR